MVLGQVVDAKASLARIAEFLDAEETQDDTTWDQEAKHAISIQNGNFTWERNTSKGAEGTPGADPKGTKQLKQEKKNAKSRQKDDQRRIKLEEKEGKLAPSTPTSPPDTGVDEEEKPFEVKNINLTVGRDELVAVIGSVGSGKSSLLAALAGDMRKTNNGNVTFSANRAFCPQYAWIQNATVKENITFGREFDRKWYNEVVDACALRPDLDMLPAGDQTEIGERGITVSGGQKQRLNIARAIYFNADIVLMDDPLSAVDAHVGKHIMDNAICGLLKGKARVLATHQLHVLHRADKIVWMKEGSIYKIATYPDLMANDTEFQKLMETTASQEQKEDIDEDEVEEEKKESKKKKGKKPAGALMQQEERAVNSVGWSVYAAYVRASGGIWVAPFIVILLIISQGANIMTSLWLSYWTSSKWNLGLGVYIGVYAALGVSQALLMFAFSVALTVLGTKASKVMLNRAIHRVLRAPMSFFDTTPMGRITNRFSKDVDTMDNNLTDSMRMFFLTMVMILSVFILIIAYYYYFVIALVPLTVMFVFSANYYRSSARELKRHEAVLRSVVFARFSESLNGQATIRAFGVEKAFQQRVDESVDSMDGAYFLTFANQRWLSTRLDALGNLLVFTVGILVVTSRFSINPSTGGLVLSYILSIVQMIQFTVRQLAEVENNMNSTERIHYYGTQLEEEAPLHLGEVRPTWPEKGSIEFDNVQMRYRDGLPLVLKGLTMQVRAGERIGVVGRTGAGKSTIMSTLFRLVELSGGSISIDGVNIATIGLHDLRSRLAIIPQDPTLFRGTIRTNLDPFNQHTDLELWNALRQADLVGESQAIDDESGRIHLDTAVEDEGLNFSLGQRQLLALARALIRGAQIIVCDEATSSVDFETDQKIQRTIVRGFRGKTLLCIAHRLKTIIGYDRILVMDQGNVAELDAPLALYDRGGGIFRGMCDRSGIRREDFFSSEEARFSVESPALERTLSAGL
jgi:ABC-type multidrug transport system fused ATPase/permease subunit